MELEKLANRLLPAMEDCCEGLKVTVTKVETQIGSGALPTAVLPSVAFRITYANRSEKRPLNALANAFRKLPIPVIGRISKDALILDLRCLEDETGFAKNLQSLNLQ